MDSIIGKLSLMHTKLRKGKMFTSKFLVVQFALQPDIGAPGVNILASWISKNDTNQIPSGQKPSSFMLDSGTSMACPHVAGIAATIKSWNPTWSPAAIRSAVMTTG